MDDDGGAPHALLDDQDDPYDKEGQHPTVHFSHQADPVRIARREKVIVDPVDGRPIEATNDVNNPLQHTLINVDRTTRSG